MALATPGPHTGLLRATTKSGLGQRLRELVRPEILGQRVEGSRVSTGMSFLGGVELPPVSRKEEREGNQSNHRGVKRKGIGPKYDTD